MADLGFSEKMKLEKFFQMNGGYVFDFSNRTFQEFFFETLGINIYDEKYNYLSGSKANRIRRFWHIESNYNVGLLIDHLLNYWLNQVQTGFRNYDQSDEAMFKECQVISSRLKDGGLVENLNSIQINPDDKDLAKLAASIRSSIEKDSPETALDRLHTFTVRYVRELCKKHGISYDINTPLHSLFGLYVKYLVENSIIESTMTERILKSSISVLESFNDVRNNKSFAHDNKILNYNESILILNDISNVIRFIDSLEKEGDAGSNGDKSKIELLDDLPF